MTTVQPYPQAVDMTGERDGVYRRHILDILRDHGREDDGYCTWCASDDWGKCSPGGSMRWAPRNPFTGDPIPAVRFGGA